MRDEIKRDDFAELRRILERPRARTKASGGADSYGDTMRNRRPEISRLEEPALNSLGREPGAFGGRKINEARRADSITLSDQRLGAWHYQQEPRLRRSTDQPGMANHALPGAAIASRRFAAREFSDGGGR